MVDLKNSQDMFFDQKRQIQNLTLRLEQAMRERRSYEEKSCQLQQVLLMSMGRYRIFFPFPFRMVIGTQSVRLRMLAVI